MRQAKHAGSKAGVGRKISSRDLHAPTRPKVKNRAAWTLRIMGGLFFIPAIIKLAVGNLAATTGSLAVAVFLILAAELIKHGTKNEQDYHRRNIAKAPPPLKAAGAGLVAMAAFLASYTMSDDGLAIAVIFGLLGGGATLYAYGLDPTQHKLLDEDSEHGVSSERVIETVRIAEGKLDEIQQTAKRLNSRAVRAQLARIVEQAQRVLQQIEKDPGDIARARRFLVTYLDGTRDVVTRYAEQQQDLTDTELAGNLARVLETIEQVFIEQEQVLKKDEALDLEVKIEVLQTQLKREGVT